MQEEEIFGFVFIGVVLLVVIVIWAVMQYVLYKCFDAIPQEHRDMEPGQVFLLLIPCFGLFWSFKVYPGLAKSYDNYFTSQGEPEAVGNYEQVGMAVAILGILSSIPYIGGCFALFYLGVLIYFYVQAWMFRGRVLDGGGQVVDDDIFR